MGWLMGFEPTTTGITIRATNYANQWLGLLQF